MKTLLLLRHAKSSWHESDLADHDRPLNARGKQAAPRIGRLLCEQHLCPELIVSSTAVRATSTAHLVAEVCGYRNGVCEQACLYLAEPEQYVRVAQQVREDVHRLMLVGHNPGIEQLIEQLTGTVASMPTAALAVLTVPVTSWAAFQTGTCCAMQQLWRPKELG